MLVRALGLSLLTLTLAAADRHESKTLPFKAGGVLTVITHNSPIEVRGWDREEVALTAEIHDSTERPVKLEVRPSGDRLEIEAVFPPWQSSLWGSGPSCAFTLQVPRRLEGEFRTSNARIDAKELNGKLTFRTSNARLNLVDLAGAVEARTSNGRVLAQRVDGDLHGGTSNASVDLEAVSGGLDFTTSNGSVSASDLDGKGKGIRLTTSNGRIEVQLGKATGEIHARTSSHERVKVERSGLELVDMDRSNMRLKVPGSSQPIELRTSNGGITIR